MGLDLATWLRREPHESAERKPPSAAQTRIIEAALREFAKNGVGGTSLQMIADDIGVTKAAVYHQYKTKDEIVRAVAGAEFDRLETVLDRGRIRGGRQTAPEKWR